MSKSRLSVQTVAQRRSAQAEVRALVGKIAPASQRLIDAARRRLRKRLPTAHELVYEYRDWFVISFSPNGQGHAGILAIRASADDVKLFFNRGKELPDPERLLQGSGKQTRWIPLEGAATFARPEVVNLIEAAIARNQVPFESVGRGPVVVRSASSK